MVRASAYCRSWLMKFEIHSKIAHPGFAFQLSGTVSNLGVRRPECNNWGGVLADRTATEEARVEFIVWVETRLAGKTLAVEEVAKFDRCASGIASEEIGLTLQQGRLA
jgi:hypothetical protein